jgi:hypothetical protein
VSLAKHYETGQQDNKQLHHLESGMRNIIVGVLLCGASQVSANQCNIEFNGNLALENQILSIQTDNNKQVRINADKALFVDGQEIILSRRQKQWVANYYDGISDAVPAAAEIAGDALTLASGAINQAFGQLLGEDSEVLTDLTYKIDSLNEEIQFNFYAEDGSIRLHSEQFKNGEFFGREWEKKFEQEIEEIVTQSIGQLMVAVGTQLIFGGGDMDEFEQRMETFGEQMENKIEFQSVALEAKANALCATLAKIDYVESKLQENISELAGLDVLRVEDSYYAM